MPSDVLVADHLSKQYGKRFALRDVTFRVARGESVGYLGPNGAGKSTTLKLLSGLCRPTSGSAQVAGSNPAVDREAALSKLGALVETPTLPPYLDGADFLDYVARVRGIPLHERPLVVRHAAQGLVPEDALRRPFGDLSTGLARRVLLAAALVGDPEVLLLDEPTLGLDPAARQDLRKILRRLATDGKTILLSTHLIEDVEEVCDRVLFLRDGSLVGDERVHTVAGRAPDTGVALRLRFAQDLNPESIASIASSGTQSVSEGPRQLLVFFTGGEREQAEVISRAVRAGPLISAHNPDPDLARRYLEKVGREEAP